MQLDKINEITSKKWKQIPIRHFNRKIKIFERQIKLNISKRFEGGNGEWRLIQKEIRTLIMRDSIIYISVTEDNLPVIGEMLDCLKTEELDFASVCACITHGAAMKYITSMDIDTLIWQAKFCLIFRYLKGEGKITDVAARLGRFSELDSSSLSDALNPLERIYSEDTLYLKMTPETRMLYRRMTAETAIATGRDEARLGREYMLRAQRKAFFKSSKKRKRYTASYLSNSEALETIQSGNAEPEHIGKIIFDEYRKLFPYKKPFSYMLTLIIFALSISIISGLFLGAWVALFAFLPIFAAIKPLIDLSVTRTARITAPIPAMETNGEIPLEAKTLCVISALLCSEKDVEQGLQKLITVKEKNNAENLSFCLLCDLPAASSSTINDDNAIIQAAKDFFEDKESFTIIIRERIYSKTQKCWQGAERKRGAIAALAESLRGNRENAHFRAVFGDECAFKDVKYILALDYDTLPLMDSVSELVGIALHPLSEGKGIIAPRMTTTLNSYLKTGFSRAMTDNGGTAGASTYDSFAGEMYQDCFGEGSFTGKGLIDVDMLIERCSGTKDFPPEKVLSHDILEGGHMGVIYAGGVEFSDSFPDTSAAYFKRQHRWLRGDLQNFPQIFNKNLSSLTRLKLADNVRRAVNPVISLSLFVYGVAAANTWLSSIAVLSVLSPYLLGFLPSLFRGWKFSNYRKFYAPVVSQTTQLIRQCVLEIMLLPKNALVSLDALVRTLWRMIVSKRHLLDWTTSHSFTKRKNGSSHIWCAEIISFFILFLCALRFDIFGYIICAFFISALPVLMFIDKSDGNPAAVITGKMRDELIAQVKQMWKFYVDNTTETHHFLPPDNVQYSPVFRVSPRTSPTNIGMYLLSVLSVYYFGIIGRQELIRRVSETIATVETLPKWRGNLMNWYDTKTLEVISGFVSSVDSGNFLCCLVALKEGLRADNIEPSLTQRIEQIIDNADLKSFYNSGKHLFSIGYDTETETLSRHHYDLIMSEARMMSYFAVGCGYAGKRHWRSLGRIMGKGGRYAAPIAWTGTMFEYFMPELLLKSKVGSMEYEALRFALHSHKKRAAQLNIPFGMSESGYYAFDNDLNYQYKAHGVAAVGLKEGLDRECVVSPYSSYLAMQLDPVGAYNNLTRLEEYGMRHTDYGFYEAVDFTVRRTGSGYAVVKSHMAHHVGMSIAAVANTLMDGILRDMFFRDPKMKRAEELLEEKIIAGETVLGNPERQKEDDSYMNTEEMRVFSLDNPRVTALSNGSITLICADLGMQETIYNNILNVRHTSDLKNPRGMIFAFVEQEHIMPFFYHPSFDDDIRLAQQKVLFRQNAVEYYREFRNLQCGLQVFLHPHRPIEIRRFSARNTSGIKRQVTLAAYLEPVLAANADVEAHPAFMDLFIKVSFDAENQLVIVNRKDRRSDNETYMAIGCSGSEDISYSFNRENVISRNQGILSAFDGALLRENDDTDTPCPCVFLKIDFPLDAHGKKDTELFICYGDSRDEVVTLAHSHRFMGVDPGEDIISPLVYDTVYGRIACKVLPHIIYAPKTDTNAVMNNNNDIKALWRYGISGDFPIVTFCFGKRTGYVDGALQMKKALSVCKIQFDLVIICRNAIEMTLTRKLIQEIGTNAHIIMEWEVDQSILTLIKAVSVYQINSNDFLQQEKEHPEPKFLPVNKCRKPKTEVSGFSEKGDVFVIDKTPELPWCNVLCNSQFGTLVSDSSLGFSWALNSRENKLTPWNNDICADNMGEMVLMKIGGDIYDLVNGSVAEFSPNKADYHGEARRIFSHIRVRVFEKGLGKEITAVLSNRGKTAKNVYLAFYAEPVLGVDRKNARFIKPSAEKNTLVLRTPSNGVFSGAMTISADRESIFQTNRNEFFSGEWKKGRLEPSYNLCAAVIVKLELPPKYTDKVKFILSFTKNQRRPLTMQTALLKQKYAPQIIAKGIETGSDKLSKLYKYWLPWQTIGCRMWARTGYYQNSGAFGFRDQLQDALVAIDTAPQIAKRQIVNAAGSQFAEGDVLHWWHSLMNTRKGVRTRYSDDLLWLAFLLAEYVKKTGDDSIIKLQVYYCESQKLADDEHEKYVEVLTSRTKDSLYEHGKRAMERAYRKGAHDLLLMGCGDWCDGYNNVGISGKGESVWLSMFYIVCAEKFKLLCDRTHDSTYKEKLEKRISELKSAIDMYAWDGEYYLRAFYDDGSPMGSSKNDLCQIDLLPQAFSVFAGMPGEERKLNALTAAIEHLTDKDKGIVKLFTPPFVKGKTAQNPGYVASYPEGIRENGGQYTHAAVWLALACKEIGMEDIARKLALMIAPFDRDKEYKTEPYYLTADVYTNPKAYGRGGWSIYTGSAGWYFRLLSELQEQ